MPVGIIINALAVLTGGIVGALAGNRLSAHFKDNLNMIFGACAMAIGMPSIVNMANMPVVILSVIVGTALGLAIHLGDKINTAGRGLQKVVTRFIPNTTTSLSKEEYEAQLITVIVLFCCSGTGIYGSIVEGISGDHSIMLAKAVLDFPTALIFACSMGMVIAVLCIPQLCVFMILFLLAGVIYPLTNETMILDFKAVGGVVMIATGFRILKVRMFPTADMIPAMILAMPLSWVWTTYITPLLS